MFPLIILSLNLDSIIEHPKNFLTIVMISLVSAFPSLSISCYSWNAPIFTITKILSESVLGRSNN